MTIIKTLVVCGEWQIVETKAKTVMTLGTPLKYFISKFKS